jgi:prepilin-type N-terminal cleavage/methylation domain-containing protein
MKPLITRHSSPTTRRAAAFTLVELLVVIAIIAILAGLGFAGVQGALESSKKAQARNDVHQIASAVKAYLLEYGRMPAGLGALTGDNPKDIVFLEAKKARNGKGGLDGNDMKDPWGESYSIEMDNDYDNKVQGHLTVVVVETTAPVGKKISNVQ